MGKEAFRFKDNVTGKYLTWGSGCSASYRYAFGLGKSCTSLKRAKEVLETMVTSSRLPCLVKDISLVRQETIISETVVGSGEEIQAEIKKKKEIEAKKKRYENFLKLQQEFAPKDPPPEVPKEVSEGDSMLTAGQLAEAVAENLWEDE